MYSFCIVPPNLQTWTPNEKQLLLNSCLVLVVWHVISVINNFLPKLPCPFRMSLPTDEINDRLEFTFE